MREDRKTRIFSESVNESTGLTSYLEPTTGTSVAFSPTDESVNLQCDVTINPHQSKD